jgi:hypothetical protein
MAYQFGRHAVVLTTASAVTVDIPSLWLARKYFPVEQAKCPTRRASTIDSLRVS